MVSDEAIRALTDAAVRGDRASWALCLAACELCGDGEQIDKLLACNPYNEKGDTTNHEL